MIGKTLNHFKVLDRLGKGGMGEVYVAEDSKLKRRVALKVLPEEMAGDSVRLDRFQREAETIAALNHPNIVTIYSIEEADGVRFLTMELVEGDTLTRLIPSKGMDVESFLRFSTPVAEALSAAHEKGIIHRDLKPGNIMVSHEGRITVLDFGLAKLMQDDSDPYSSRMETRAHTEDGIVLGTMPYMSPEQIQGKKLDHRSDIFSLGIIFYEMITGCRPFQGDTSADLISSILRDTPDAVSDLKAELPEHLGRIIRRCLMKDPRDRYQTVRDVYIELRDLTTTSGSTSRPRVAASAPSAGEMWIAVLPFKNPGADPELEALSDGLTEEITLGLSRFSYLHVISRHSTVIYRDKGMDIRTIGREIGARYILEGTIRKLGSSLRFSTQLLDTTTGAHLWNDTYKKDVSGVDLFELQDDIASRIASTVADTSGALVRSMVGVIRTKPSETLSPYEAVVRSLAYWQVMAAEEHKEARACLQRAVELSPDYADAWAMLARMYTQEHNQGFNPQPDPLGRALAAARRAIGLDAANQIGYGALAEVSFFRRDSGTFRTAGERAIQLNPLNGDMVAFIGLLTAYSGDWERGIQIAERAMALNPHHPGWYHFGAFLHFYRLRNYNRALEIAEKINMPSYFYSHVMLAVVNAQLGRMDAAQNAVKELLTLVPDFANKVRTELGEKWLWVDPDFVDHLIEGLRKAGLKIPDSAESTSPVAKSDQAQAGADSDAVRAQPHAMWIAVLPFQHPSEDPEIENFADGLVQDITAALSQFSYLSVIARNSTLRLKGQSYDVRTASEQLGARYVLQGGIRKSGSLIRVNVQLVDAQTGTNLWAETYNRDLQESDIFATQDNITDRVVATVADGYGVLVRSMAVALENKPDEELSAAEWVIRLYGYRQKLKPDDHARLKESLERAIERNPKQADVWACLCQIYLDEYGFGYNTKSDSLERALAAGRRALEIDRTSQLGCQLIAQTHFFMRDIAAFRPAAEWAISLNSRDTNTLAILGIMIAHTRDFERAAELTRRAMEINPSHAGWYHFGLIWYHFQKQEYEKALEHANKVNMPGMFWTYLATASINALLGRQTEAAAALRDLLRLDPDFSAKARANIEAWHYASGLMDKLLEGLRKAGMDIPGIERTNTKEVRGL